MLFPIRQFQRIFCRREYVFLGIGFIVCISTLGIYKEIELRRWGDSQINTVRVKRQGVGSESDDNPLELTPHQMEQDKPFEGKVEDVREQAKVRRQAFQESEAEKKDELGKAEKPKVEEPVQAAASAVLPPPEKADNISPDQLAYMQQTIKKRLTRIDEVCAENDNFKTKTYRKIDHRHLLFDEKHSFIFCWAHKVASSSMAIPIAKMNNLTFDPSEYWKVFNVMRLPKERAETAARDTKFYRYMTVRHPFSRILSAYKDRIINLPDSYTALKSGLDAVLKARPWMKKDDVVKTVDGVEKLVVIPTFPEFVKMIISNGVQKCDSHWQPYWKNCNLCKMKYDAILKMENLNDEVPFVLKKMKLDGILQIKHEHKTLGNVSTSDDLEIKYATVPIQDQKALASLYDEDFKLFGYDLKLPSKQT